MNQKSRIKKLIIFLISILFVLFVLYWSKLTNIKNSILELPEEIAETRKIKLYNSEKILPRSLAVNKDTLIEVQNYDNKEHKIYFQGNEYLINSKSSVIFETENIGTYFLSIDNEENLLGKIIFK